MTPAEQQELLALRWWFSTPRSMTKENKARYERLKELTTKSLIAETKKTDTIHRYRIRL